MLHATNVRPDGNELPFGRCTIGRSCTLRDIRHPAALALKKEVRYVTKFMPVHVMSVTSGIASQAPLQKENEVP